MIRRVIYLLLVFFMPFSCVLPLEQEWKGPVIELTMKTGDLHTKAGTDGQKDGEDIYNENLISWVDLFFYPEGKTNEDAVYYKHVDSGKRYSDVLRLEMLYSEINGLLFPETENVTNCTVFVVVNYSGTLLQEGQGLSGTSLPQLESLMETTDFLGDDFRHSYYYPNFVMTGSADLALRGRNQVVAAAGIINLARLACKMTVGVSVVDEVTIDQDVWKPMLEGMEVYLVNGVQNVLLSGQMPASPEYISYRNRPRPFAEKDLEGNLHFFFGQEESYYQTYPTYMYPQHWEYGSDDSPEKEPYLKLVVPWVKNNGENQRQFYYKIVIPEDTRGEEFVRSFVRNNWYHISVNVNILGSETDDARVPIVGCCYIAYWQDKETVIKEATIGNVRYLSVIRDTTQLYNISSEVDIRYTSSHRITIKDVKATRPYYGTKKSGEAMGGQIHLDVDGEFYRPGTYYVEYDGSRQWFTIKDDKYITFQNTLFNDYRQTSFDYSPYTVSCTIVHNDLRNDANTPYQKRITVIQYPAVYIEQYTNSDSNQPGIGGTTTYYSGTNNYNLTSTYWGYVFVDGGAYMPNTNDNVMDSDGCIWVPGKRQVRRGHKPITGVDSVDMFFKLGPAGESRQKSEIDPAADARRREYQWRTVWYTGGSMDIFKINVTVLQEDSEFIIGDPRTLTINNLDYPPEPQSPQVDPFASQFLPKRDSFAHAPALYSESGDLDGCGHRTLSYYYPADTDERTKYMLAPSYRVSSKFSGVEFAGEESLYYYVGDIQKNFAEYRCATYQEDGFPAGRWRLPTFGEVSFIAQLSANGTFATLFNTGKYYWSAHGAVLVQGGTSGQVELKTNITKALLRCVYDTWYWGDDQTEYDNWRKSTPEWQALPDGNGIGEKGKELRNQFVWGDRPRDYIVSSSTQTP